MRDEVISLDGDIKALYTFLRRNGEVLCSDVLLGMTRSSLFNYRYKKSYDCWVTTTVKSTISINEFIAKYKSMDLSSIYELDS